MKRNSLAITVVSVEREMFDIESAADLTGIHPEMIREFARGQLVQIRGSDNEGCPVFDESGICRLRMLADWRHPRKTEPAHDPGALSVDGSAGAIRGGNYESAQSVAVSVEWNGLEKIMEFSCCGVLWQGNVMLDIGFLMLVYAEVSLL